MKTIVGLLLGVGTGLALSRLRTARRATSPAARPALVASTPSRVAIDVSDAPPDPG